MKDGYIPLEEFLRQNDENITIEELLDIREEYGDDLYLVPKERIDTSEHDV